MWIFSFLILGSGNQLIKTAGIAAIANVSLACGYGSVTELINNNIDYFSYHVIRKIQHAEHNESVLNVLTIVIKYGDMNILQSISDIIGGVSLLLIFISLINLSTTI